MKDVEFTSALRGKDIVKMQLEDCYKVCECDYMVRRVQLEQFLIQHKWRLGWNRTTQLEIAGLYVWHRWKNKVGKLQQFSELMVCSLVLSQSGEGISFSGLFSGHLVAANGALMSDEIIDAAATSLSSQWQRDFGPFKGKRKRDKNWWFKFKINTRSRHTFRLCWMNMSRNKHHGMKPMMFQSLQEMEDLSIHVVVISECGNKSKGTSRLQVWQHGKTEASEFLILSLMTLQSNNGNGVGLVFGPIFSDHGTTRGGKITDAEAASLFLNQHCGDWLKQKKTRTLLKLHNLQTTADTSNLSMAHIEGTKIYGANVLLQIPETCLRMASYMAYQVVKTRSHKSCSIWHRWRRKPGTIGTSNLSLFMRA
ncbi:unnamed protein product [Arabidopsis thaliana]|uniref:Uncharacterized protein n=1 Tax=Arabidopsis thaliana TaxID=3702 RepID=A0A654G502_ARATH|nr:unnamed protein product [Arabidopsis thaliana]